MPKELPRATINQQANYRARRIHSCESPPLCAGTDKLRELQPPLQSKQHWNSRDNASSAAEILHARPLVPPGKCVRLTTAPRLRVRQLSSSQNGQARQRRGRHVAHRTTIRVRYKHRNLPGNLRASTPRSFGIYSGLASRANTRAREATNIGSPGRQGHRGPGRGRRRRRHHGFFRRHWAKHNTRRAIQADSGLCSDRQPQQQQLPRHDRAAAACLSRPVNRRGKNPDGGGCREPRLCSLCAVSLRAPFVAFGWDTSRPPRTLPRLCHTFPARRGRC